MPHRTLPTSKFSSAQGHLARGQQQRGYDHHNGHHERHCHDPIEVGHGLGSRAATAAAPAVLFCAAIWSYSHLFSARSCSISCRCLDISTAPCRTRLARYVIPSLAISSAI